MWDSILFRYLYALLRIGVASVVGHIADRSLGMYKEDISSFTVRTIKKIFGGIADFFFGIFGNKAKEENGYYYYEDQPQAQATA